VTKITRPLNQPLLSAASSSATY